MLLEGGNLVWSLLDQHRFSDKWQNTAVADDQRILTYARLFHCVHVFIAEHPALFAHGPGTRVLCLSEDSLELVIVLLALMRCGLVPCLVNPNLPQAVYEDYLAIVRPACIVLAESHQQQLQCIFTAEQRSCFILATDFASKADKTILSTGYSNVPYRLQSVSDAFGLFTSGTTGAPNLVIHRHQDPLVTNRNYVQPVLQVTANDRLFSSSKLFFAYGLNSLLYALMNGATAVLAPRDASLEKIGHIINRYKPSIMFSVPTMYFRLLEHPPLPKAINEIRLCVSAGEHLPPALYRRWKNTCKTQLVDGIGTTEMLSTFISNTITHCREGSTGKIVPGFEVEIRDEKNRPLLPGMMGVLWVKGDTCPGVYINNPKSSADRFVNGWFKTCDLFSCDEDGFYYYHGRASEVMKCGGLWIFPQRIERVLNAHPAVLESMVKGEVDQGLSRPVAHIVLRHAEPDLKNLESALKNECKKICSKHEYPHKIYFVNDLPKTTTGKLKRL